VLKSVVGAISGVLRRPDVFCRYGGEEFAVLLPEADAVGASRLAERIRSVVEERTIRINRKDEHVTISVGVAVYTERDREFGDLITRADDALYSAKHKGRNTVVVSV
jgi:two-component system cell cycle response regulator